MQDDAFVVVFPSEFSRRRTGQLVENIRGVLKARGQEFQSVKRDGGVVVVRASDPVFASSAINQLFGIERIAIARQARNDFKSVVSEITRLGGSLLLRGEKFLVRIEGDARGFVPRDAEMAATSSIIEKKSGLGAAPGSEGRHDKLLYTYITRKFAYVCIFLDHGHGGVPNCSQNQGIVCPVYDGISAVSCIETIRRGFDVRIVAVYRKKSELNRIAKMLSRVIAHTPQERADLEFYSFGPKQKISNRYDFVNSTVQLCRIIAENAGIQRVSVPISDHLFPVEFTESISRFIYGSGLIPYLPIQGLEDGIRDMAREYVLEGHVGRIAVHAGRGFSDVGQARFVTNAAGALERKQAISVRIGPNNLHDILDAIENH